MADPNDATDPPSAPPTRHPPESSAGRTVTPELMTSPNEPRSSVQAPRIATGTRYRVHGRSVSDRSYFEPFISLAEMRNPSAATPHAPSRGPPAPVLQSSPGGWNPPAHDVVNALAVGLRDNYNAGPWNPPTSDALNAQAVNLFDNFNAGQRDAELGTGGLSPALPVTDNAGRPDAQLIPHLPTFNARMETNFTLLVDRIINKNDKRASMTLQDQIRHSAAGEERLLLISAIKNRAHLLMINRFGNYVIQQLLAHGTPDEVESIMGTMLGHVVQLSNDEYGNRVVHNAIVHAKSPTCPSIVKELLANPLLTVDHVWGWNVWKELFNSVPCWKKYGPEIMNSFNEKLKGEWVKVAVGFDGSSILRILFEKCTRDQMKPSLEEIVTGFDTVIRSEHGNQVVQKLLENGDKDVRAIVIKKIIDSAFGYSIDEFASKAVKRMLEKSKPEVIQEYLLKVTKCRSGRNRRPPLVGIALSIYGTHLVQYLLTRGTARQRKQIATQLNNHMAHLCGSEGGRECALLI